jgi:hypothetical protein
MALTHNHEAPRDSKARLSRLWHLTLAAVVLVAFAIQLTRLVTGGVDVNSGSADVDASLTIRFIRLLSYFTIQSNLLVLVVALSLIANPSRDGRVWRVLRLDMLLGMTITGAVFPTILARVVHHTGAAVWANFGFHYFAPWWTLLGWLLFGPRPRISWSTVVLAFVWPILWLGCTLIRGAMTGWYPYPFLDVSKLGYANVSVNIALVLLAAVLVAVTFKALDLWLPRLHAKGGRGR